MVAVGAGMAALAVVAVVAVVTVVAVVANLRPRIRTKTGPNLGDTRAGPNLSDTGATHAHLPPLTVSPILLLEINKHNNINSSHTQSVCHAVNCKGREH